MIGQQGARNKKVTGQRDQKIRIISIPAKRYTPPLLPLKFGPPNEFKKKINNSTGSHGEQMNLKEKEENY